MSGLMVYAIGLIAQGLFFARQLVQWIASERAKKVLSPTLFWQLSMAASLLLCIYGWLRNDFAIILGQLVTYYIYIWNINSKGEWHKMPLPIRIILISIPAAALMWFGANWENTAEQLFQQENIPAWLIVYGVAGQFTFTLRFIYQWWYSRRKGESLLPTTFWLISLTGSMMIISYAIIRHDPILILGQATGFIVYLRNIMIGHKAAKRERANKQTEKTIS